MLPGEIGITARVDLQYRNRSAVIMAMAGLEVTRKLEV
jgi:hypothetical protein